jgi:hypothetical protein
MWEFRPFKREKQARDKKKEKSLQQFHINNIGRHPTIQAKNRNIIHTRGS